MACGGRQVGAMAGLPGAPASHRPVLDAVPRRRSSARSGAARGHGARIGADAKHARGRPPGRVFDSRLFRRAAGLPGVRGASGPHRADRPARRRSQAPTSSTTKPAMESAGACPGHGWRGQGDRSERSSRSNMNSGPGTAHQQHVALRRVAARVLRREAQQVQQAQSPSPRARIRHPDHQQPEAAAPPERHLPRTRGTTRPSTGTAVQQATGKCTSAGWSGCRGRDARRVQACLSVDWYCRIVVNSVRKPITATSACTTITALGCCCLADMERQQIEAAERGDDQECKRDARGSTSRVPASTPMISSTRPEAPSTPCPIASGTWKLLRP